METVERETDLEAAPDDVWAAVVDGSWLGDDVSLDARPGGTGSLVDPDGAVRHVLVEEVVPGRRLGLWWWRDGEGEDVPTFVAVELEPLGRGTRLRVVETRVAAPPTVPSAWALARV